MTGPTVGVLALQGDAPEHLRVLTRLGAPTVAVRRPAELDRCDALVVPGGESTAMGKLARSFEILEPVRDRIQCGMPVFGTCAGMILLADRVADGVPEQETFGGLDITVRRNAFGRQVDSFETDLAVAGVAGPVHGVFIRAPWVEQLGPDVDVLARVVQPQLGDRVVAVRQGPLLATSFHPEIASDPRLHELFLDVVARR